MALSQLSCPSFFFIAMDLIEVSLSLYFSPLLCSAALMDPEILRGNLLSFFFFPLSGSSWWWCRCPAPAIFDCLFAIKCGAADPLLHCIRRRRALEELRARRAPIFLIYSHQFPRDPPHTHTQIRYVSNPPDREEGDGKGSPFFTPAGSHIQPIIPLFLSIYIVCVSSSSFF